MTIGQGNKITAADINSLISKINSEENERTTNRTTPPTSYTDLPTVSIGDKILASKHDDMRIRIDNIDALHCYCESDASIQTHHGGTPLAQTSPDVAVGEQINESTDTDFSSMDSDIDALIAQCACDSNICGECTCDGVCGCNVDCGCVADVYCATSVYK